MNRSRLVRFGKRVLGRLYGDALVPASLVRLLRRIGGIDDALLPPYGSTPSTGLRNRYLADSLRDVELGTWSIGAHCLNFLERRIQRLKPQLVLEFGSGVSTVCLARYMRELHGDPDRVYVVSVDQDPRFIADTIKLLDRRQLAQHARIFLSPLRRQTIEGVDALCYDIPDDRFNDAFTARHPDFVLVDGPAADHPARFGTLPLARHWLSARAYFVLDDALRDGELQVGQMWRRLPYVSVNGFYLREKGLLVGSIAGDTAHQSGA